MLAKARQMFSIPAKAIGIQNLLRLSQNKLILPFYHTVSDTPLPHIAPLYRHKTVNEFKNDLEFLLKNFQPVSLQDVNLHIKGIKEITKPSFHLSFDDGLQEIYSTVLPILKEKGIPSTLFVNPAFVDNKRLFFRHKAALLIDKLEKKGFHRISTPTDNKAKEWEQLILTAQYHQETRLDELGILLEVDFNEYLEKKHPYLSIGELKRLSLNGVEIGAHSLDHPEYQFISVDEQLRQTKESMDWVKEHFNPKVNAFSFPFTDFGVGRQFFKLIENDVNSPELFFGTAGQKTEINTNHLQRIPIETSTKNASSVIAGEMLSSLIKKGIGKSVITRTA